MKLFIILSLIYCTSVFSNSPSQRKSEFESIKSCYRGISFQDEWMAYGDSPKSIIVKNYLTGNKKVLTYSSSVIDFMFSDRKLFVLYGKNVKIYDLEKNFMKKQFF